MNEYVTLAEVKATLGLPTQTYADPDISRAIEAASRSIDAVCRRRFYLDTADSDRLYSAPSGDSRRGGSYDIATGWTAGATSLLRIDDLNALTSLSGDPNGSGSFTQTWDPANVSLEPLNREIITSVGTNPAVIKYAPFTAIRLRPGQTLFPSKPGIVKVTGRFGWAAVPPAIAEASTILAIKLLRRVREAPFGILTAGGLDAATAMRIARSDPDVGPLVEPYMRKVLFV